MYVNELEATNLRNPGNSGSLADMYSRLSNWYDQFYNEQSN